MATWARTPKEEEGLNADFFPKEKQTCRSRTLLASELKTLAATTYIIALRFHTAEVRSPN